MHKNVLGYHYRYYKILDPIGLVYININLFIVPGPFLGYIPVVCENNFDTLPSILVNWNFSEVFFFLKKGTENVLNLHFR